MTDQRLTYEQRFSVPLLKGCVFVRRPVATPPPEGTICIVDSGTFELIQHRTAGQWIGGRWTNGKGCDLKREPTHWTDMELTK